MTFQTAHADAMHPIAKTIDLRSKSAAEELSRHIHERHNTIGIHAITPTLVGWHAIAINIERTSVIQAGQFSSRERVVTSHTKQTAAIDANRITNANGRNSVPKKSEFDSTATHQTGGHASGDLVRPSTDTPARNAARDRDRNDAG